MWSCLRTGGRHRTLQEAQGLAQNHNPLPLPTQGSEKRGRCWWMRWVAGEGPQKPGRGKSHNRPLQEWAGGHSGWEKQEVGQPGAFQENNTARAKGAWQEGLQVGV